jgi:DnaJ family protein A protein 2
MPSQRHHEPGDLYVKVSVRFPDNIDPESISLLDRALPPRKPMEKIGKNILLEEVTMEDADNRTRRSMHDRDESMDGDHDEARVQCANQ